jgi:hypothetical protein
MSDLSDVLKDAVGEIPAFAASALVAKQRHRRQLQAAGAASTVAAVALFVALAFNHGSDGGIAIKTRASGSTSATATTDASGSTTSSDGTSTTLPPFSDTTVRGAPNAIPPRAPQPGDFTGTLALSSTTVRVGEGVDMQLRIHNTSGVAIDTSENASPTKLALYCDRANPAAPGKNGVFGYYDAWYVPSPTMQPGADAVLTARFAPSADLLGDASCQAVIVSPAEPRFFPTWVVVTAIPAVPITVLPADSATTTTTTATPITTLPPTTVPTT